MPTVILSAASRCTMSRRMVVDASVLMGLLHVQLEKKQYKKQYKKAKPL